MKDVNIGLLVVGAVILIASVILATRKKLPLSYIGGVLGMAAVGMMAVAIGFINFNTGETDFPEACNNDERYEDGDVGLAATMVDEDERGQMTANFMNLIYRPGTETALQSPVQRHSGFISKQILDVIFNDHPRANGVMCYVGWIPGQGLQMVVTPGTETDVQLPREDISTYNFHIRAYCPPKCGTTR